jgi:hypothetical protein
MFCGFSRWIRRTEQGTSCGGDWECGVASWWPEKWGILGTSCRALSRFVEADAVGGGSAVDLSLGNVVDMVHGLFTNQSVVAQ